MSWSLLIQQLQVSASTAQAKPPRFNPRPPGQIQDGSGTSAVIDFMARSPDRWFTRAEIIELTGRSEKSVDWAIAFLVQQKIVRTVQDESRNCRYRRFKYVGK